MQFDSLVYLLQDYPWLNNHDVIGSGGSHDPLAVVGAQSHDLDQPGGANQDPIVVGAPTIQLEPHSHLLGTSPLLSPLMSSDTFCDLPVTPESTDSPIINSAPANDHPVVDFSDMTDSELEKILSPFSSESDSSFGPEYFDLESFMAA